MRLINTSTLNLELVDNADEHPYAILSHTWGNPSDEVSFQEFQNLDIARQKRGFTKIQRTCERAQQQGLKFAWVDTCCIDKSSSAELSEAINSMFRWYRDSTICLVFLSDLPADVAFEEGFPGCNWLNRGWTLQELIAPRNVEFYDETWKLRSSKLEDERLLSRVTGIDTFVLQDSAKLDQVVVAKRMSWAARRITTRVEDMAYCLLGIFDINMPMIYGEGSKAFIRLEEEIAKQSCDLSLFAWTAQPSNPTSCQMYRGIFARSPEEFANCGQLRNQKKSFTIEKEFAITNKGMRIETTLVQLIEGPHSDEPILNLGIAEEENLFPYKPVWMGVYLTKTAFGYVRASPRSIYTANHEPRYRCRTELLYVRKDVSQLDSHSLETQYSDAIHVRIHSPLGVNPGVRINAKPPELWDERRNLFLTQGSGINAYVFLQFPASMCCPAIELVIACSTMGEPVCGIWSDQSQMFHNIRYYLKNAKDLSELQCGYRGQGGQGHN
ncbi:hypothetical protein H9L39_20189 [Fusarium oxysporum f. sp. albedinis]|nr:hypothetical protein H9L39_20189 [Fusarium oxysporum f. sp. albedinis]